MLEVSQQTVSSIYSNTPLMQALLEDGPQFKTHLAWLVTLELGILQNPGQTASLSPGFAGITREKQLHHTKL
jgi:hypothetical protein